MAGETGSPLLIAATVLGVFAVVVGAIVSARKSLKSRRDSLLPLAEVEDDAARSTSPLASVDANGVPSVRMVLLKEILPEGFVFYTNYTSRKSGELLATGKAAFDQV